MTKLKTIEIIMILINDININKYSNNQSLAYRDSVFQPFFVVDHGTLLRKNKICVPPHPEFIS